MITDLKLPVFKTYQALPKLDKDSSKSEII